MKHISLSNLAPEGVRHNPEIAKKVMLKNGEIPHLTNFSQAVLTTGQSTTAHRHEDMYEIYLVESGSGRMTIDGATINIETGDCIVVEPKENHSLVNHGAANLVLTYFGVATT